MERTLLSQATGEIIVAHNPLSYQFALVRTGHHGGMQRYDSWSGLYTPDYSDATGIPFTIGPRLLLTDPDGVLADGDYTAQIDQTCFWYVVYADGRREELSAGVEGFTINPDMTLTVRRNAEPDTQLTLEFEGTFTDPRGTGLVLELQGSFSVRCESVSEAPPRLVTDRPARVRYNPVARRGDVTDIFRFTLERGGEALADADSYFIVERQTVDGNGNNAWTPLGGQKGCADIGLGDTAEEVLEYMFEVSGANNNTLAVRLDLMGEGERLRVRGTWRGPDGLFYPLRDASPEEYLELVRRYPNIRTVLHRTTSVSSGGAGVYAGTAKLYMGKDEITDPDEVFDIEHTLTRYSGGKAQKPVTVATGAVVTSAPLGTALQGSGLPVVNVYPKGDWKALVLSDGSLLALGDGRLLLARE